MSETYKHPNGTIVNPAGGGATITSDGVKGCAFEGEDFLILSKDVLEAIQAAYLASLGLWRDSESGCLVQCDFVIASGRYGVIDLDREEGIPRNGKEGDFYAEVVARHLKSTEPKLKAGEIWEVTLDDGSKRLAHVSLYGPGESLRLFSLGEATNPYKTNIPKRRVVDANRQWVGDES